MWILCVLLSALVVNNQGYVLSKSFIKEDTFKEIRNLTFGLSEGNVFPATVDIFGDQIMVNLNKLILQQDLDPLPVEDVNEGHWYGRLKLTNISIEGISTLYRAGDARLTYYHDNRHLQIDIVLGFQDLKFGCNYKVAVIGIGPGGSVTGGVDGMEMTISLQIDFTASEAKVLRYEITKSGHLSIDFHGEPLTDWWTNILLNSITAIFKWVILDSVDDVVKKNLDNLVNIINYVLHALLG